MNLLLIGCGRIGRLFLGHWASNPDIEEIWVVQPSLSEAVYFKQYPHIHFVKNAAEVPEFFSPEGVIISIKPEQVSSAIGYYQIYRANATFISLAAGVSIDTLKQYLGKDAAIARVMPNIAIKVQESLNLAFIPENAPEKTRDLVEKVCEGSGYFMPLTQEQAIDQLTVISGSGPAYFFLLMEALIQNAIAQCGVDKKTALTLVRQTFLGSALLLKDQPEADPQNLRNQVTSKGGVTEAIVEVLKEPLFSNLKEAIEKGIQRIKEYE